MPKTIFACSKCGAQFQKWTGRCLECGAWGSVKEGMLENSEKKETTKFSPAETTKFSEIKSQPVDRIPTNIAELDRVLGGGIVPGSLILLGGEPGIGKSTLAMQLSGLIDRTLYVSGEESGSQVKMRADRLKIKTTGLEFASETNVDKIASTIISTKPCLAIIDSIQTIRTDEANGEAGGTGQIRAATAKLLEVAKTTNTAVIIIGHVTKDGAVAGPKTLEHMVDTVLYLEGERYHTYRVLRAVKNRFGATDEVGVFEMRESGLNEVKNPSAAFLSERGENAPGNILTVLIEGTRPIIVEVQALVNKTVFGYPVRKASGFDLNRLHVLAAILQRRANLNLAQSDIYLNVAGGIEATEPAVDLAVCLAIASAYKDKALGTDLAVFGEVGLGGEIRSVSQTEKRIKECEILGLKRIILPQTSKRYSAGKINLLSVGNIVELVKHA
ncbi:MAG TPA: DNA repair protein RadA [Candidatus Magasanikbacteria bacterium]|nr:DNA repair protein RadA [Candidatus Magasanikbacteria bacterium]